LAFVLLTCSATLLTPAMVGAQPAGDARRDALKLAGEAMDLLQAGDFAAALDKFNEADALVPAPTLKLRIARCLDKLDRMKEAAEKYREVIATELTPQAPAQHREARKQAVPELAALLEQMPSLTVRVTGQGSADASVSMEGTPLPAEVVGNKQQMDPGRYVFEAVVGERRVKEDVVLARGDDRKVVLTLPQPEAGADVTPGTKAGGGSGVATVGWTAVVLGGAALSVGSILGVVVLNSQGDLEDRCPNRQCLPDAHDDARVFNSERIASTALLVVGGVAAVVGVTMVLLAPTPADDRGTGGATLRARVGPWGARLEGRF
jgi:hypothetical protein